MTYKFVNPYHFVPIPDRSTEADGPPPGHGVLVPGLYSGSFPLTITCVTPLIIPDPHSATDKGTPILKAPDGKPLLPVSSFKGALRSMFEAVTNSRFGVLGDHATPLAKRESVKDGNRKLPAVVVGDGEKMKVHVVTKLEPKDAEGGFLPAVFVPWALLHLPRPPRNVGATQEEVDQWIMKWDTKEVVALIRPVKHKRNGFKAWRASALVDPQNESDLELAACSGRCPACEGSFECLNLNPIVVRGRLIVTGRTIRNKHDERLVVTEVLKEVLKGEATFDPKEFEVTEAHEVMWKAAVGAYRSTSAGVQLPLEVHAGPYSKPPDKDRDDWALLGPGRTLYVTLEKDEISGMSPAMIARKPFPNAPIECVPDSLRPAKNADELSPSDRVFGWVGQGSEAGAWRGLLRIDPFSPTPETESKIAQFCPGVRLAPLESPKPSQHAFYTCSKKGDPYGDGSRLRGRKVYLHDNSMPKDSWAVAEVIADEGKRESGKDPKPIKEGSSRYREFLAVPVFDENKKVATYPESSMAIVEWLCEGSSFNTTIRFHNLTGYEFGALVWLLRCDPSPVRLGHGKPLGFGVVRTVLNLDRFKVRKNGKHGNHYRDRAFANGDEVGLLSKEDLVSLVNDFVSKADESIKEFVAAVAAGVDTPVHYPREGPNPRLPIYDWFKKGAPLPEATGASWTLTGEAGAGGKGRGRGQGQGRGRGRGRGRGTGQGQGRKDPGLST